MPELFEFTELEFKYLANEISLSKAKKFFESLEPAEFIEIGSWDYYYTHKDNLEMFIRDRGGPGTGFRELTSKRKTIEHNNNVREEIDLEVDSDINTYNKFLKMTGIDKGSVLKQPSNAAIQLKVDLSKVLEEARERGYLFNFEIYKMCWIYKFKNHTTGVYYITYDTDFKETGRFLEVEADKKYAWTSKEEALAAVKEIEKKFTESFGISAQNRLRQSLYERFRRTLEVLLAENNLLPKPEEKK
jgi:adenylate cyclase class IV